MSKMWSSGSGKGRLRNGDGNRKTASVGYDFFYLPATEVLAANAAITFGNDSLI